jgi:hypothetical protein
VPVVAAEQAAQVVEEVVPALVLVASVEQEMVWVPELVPVVSVVLGSKFAVSVQLETEHVVSVAPEMELVALAEQERELVVLVEQDLVQEAVALVAWPSCSFPVSPSAR